MKDFMEDCWSMRLQAALEQWHCLGGLRIIHVIALDLKV